MDFPLGYIPNSGSQLERALREYFRSVGAVPDPDHPTGAQFQTLEVVGDRQYIGRSLLAHSGTEDVPFSGNQNYLVDIVDQFPAIPQPGDNNPEGHRVAIDRQVGKMMWWMHQTDDGAQTFNKTARNLTDSGRALAPTSFSLVKCGTAAINGAWVKTDNQTWTHLQNPYSIIWNEENFRWELLDANEIVLYTLAAGGMPTGTWLKGTATAAAPVFSLTDAEKTDWNHADMANFTCQFVEPIGQSRGLGVNGDEEQIDATVWREVRRFRIKVSPSAIAGYSNNE